MKIDMFGKLHRALRSRRGVGLRQYCVGTGFDPAYISKVERGLLRAPSNPLVLIKMRDGLGLKKGGREWKNFWHAAMISSIRPQAAHELTPELIKKLPVFLCIANNKQLTDKKLNKLIKLILDN